VKRREMRRASARADAGTVQHAVPSPAE